VAAFHPESVGIFGLVSEMLRLSARMSEMRQLAKEGADLRVKADSFREPMAAAVNTTLDDAKGMSSASRPATEDPRAMESRGMRIDRLTRPVQAALLRHHPAGRAEHRHRFRPPGTSRME